jgi:hypothetical protein
MPRPPISRALLIGAAVVGTLVVAGLIVRTLGTGRFSTATPSGAASLAENRATEPTTPPKADATEDSTSAIRGQLEPLLIVFSEPNTLADWERTFMGRQSKAAVSKLEDGLMFHLDDANLRAYFTYKPGNYKDVSIRLLAENLGQKSYRVGLVCRRNGDTWYEYTVIGGGLWQLHEHNASYILRSSGGTHALDASSNINEYEMLCIDDELTLRINGQEVTSYQIKDNAIAQGQVGFSVASNESVFPITMKILEFEVSDQK